MSFAEIAAEFEKKSAHQNQIYMPQSILLFKEALRDQQIKKIKATQAVDQKYSFFHEIIPNKKSVQQGLSVFFMGLLNSFKPFFTIMINSVSKDGIVASVDYPVHESEYQLRISHGYQSEFSSILVEISQLSTTTHLYRIKNIGSDIYTVNSTSKSAAAAAATEVIKIQPNQSVEIQMIEDYILISSRNSITSFGMDLVILRNEFDKTLYQRQV
jgi:hypothetical protein